MSNITNFYKPSDSPFLGQVRQVLRLKQIGRSTEKDNIERARRPKRLPVVLTRDEVQKILAIADGVEGLFLHTEQECY